MRGRVKGGRGGADFQRRDRTPVRERVSGMESTGPGGKREGGGYARERERADVSRESEEGRLDATGP